MNKYSLSIFPVFIIFFLLTCTSPQNPFSQDKAKVFLHLESSANIASDSTITDTTWNSVRIGISYFMPEYFDSVIITVEKNIQNVDTFFVWRKADIKDDTAWFEYTFKSEGPRTLTATGYAEGGYKPSATANITILSRPINHKPYLIITGKKSITTVEACTLFVSVNDSDTTQAHTFQVLKGPTGYAFANQIFTWKPASPADTGIDSITFRVADNGVPVMADTQAVLLAVKTIPQIIDSTKPMIRFSDPAKDSISINTNSYTVKVVCKDTSGVASVSCTMGATSFPVNKSIVADNIWSAMVTGLTPGQFSALTIVAVDSSLAANKDTLVLHIKYDNDTIAPIITRFDPAKDSISVNSNSYFVKVVCKDPSGVAAVVYTLGSANLPATKSSDTIWSAAITGLAPSVFSKIAVIATDASLRTNKDTMILYIKYDSSIADLVGPIFFQKNGPMNNAIVTDSNLTIIDSIYDPSGVDSVYWTLNGKNPKPLTLVSGKTNLYSLTDTLRRFHLDTIVISAQDKSTNRNKSSQTIILNYNVPPVINDTSVSTNRNTAKTWGLNFQSVDGDQLTWSRLTSPSALSGTVTGTLPSATFTPVINWVGTDSFFVRVTDGYWSDTAKISISIGALPRYHLSITTVNGTVTPQPVGPDYDSGATVAVTATPNNGYRFASWTGDLTGDSAHAQLIMNSNKTITANFMQLIAPTISQQPQAMQTARIGDTVKLSVTATGDPLPKYQWYKNGSVLTGKTDSVLVINNIQRSDSAIYYVAITNSVQSISSHDAVLNVRYAKAVYAGSSIFFITNDGILWGCGSNWIGQIGDGTTKDVLQPEQIMTDVVSVSPGPYNTLFLKKDATLWGCGDNGFGQLGDTVIANYLTPTRVCNQTVISFCTGQNRTAYIPNNGLLWICGQNYFGDLGIGTLDNSKVFVQVPTVSYLSAINMGDGNSTFVLENDHSLWAWGSNCYGQLGDSSLIDRLSPKQIMPNVSAVASGQWHTLILGTNGTVYGCGYAFFGQLAGLPDSTKIPTPITNITGVKAISASGMNSLFLKSDSTLWGCGDDENGQLGDGNSTISQPVPKKIGGSVASFCCGSSKSVFIKSDGTLWGCGMLGVGDSATYNKPVLIPKRIF